MFPFLYFFFFAYSYSVKMEADFIHILPMNDEVDLENSIIDITKVGIADGLQEARQHHIQTRDLSEVDKEKSDFEFRRSFIRRLRNALWDETEANGSTYAYIIAAAISGISFQLSNGFSYELALAFDVLPGGGVSSFGAAISNAVILGIQTFILALASPLDRSALPSRFREAPKAALLGGVFSALNVFSVVLAIPALGVGATSLANVVIDVLSGILIDQTGFFGYVEKRQFRKSQLAGALTLGMGVISTMEFENFNFHVDPNALSNNISYIAFLIFGSACGSVSSALNTSLLPFAGSSVKSAVASNFVGTMALMVLAFTLASNQPAVNLEHTTWWNWVGSIASVYGVWAGAVLPSKLGIGRYICVGDASFALSAVATDALGVFGEAKPFTSLRVIGVALCILGIVILQMFPAPAISANHAADSGTFAYEIFGQSEDVLSGLEGERNSQISLEEFLTKSRTTGIIDSEEEHDSKFPLDSDEKDSQAPQAFDCDESIEDSLVSVVGKSQSFSKGNQDSKSQTFSKASSSSQEFDKINSRRKLE